jgi:hypothetical protein
VRLTVVDPMRGARTWFRRPWDVGGARPGAPCSSLDSQGAASLLLLLNLCCSSTLLLVYCTRSWCRCGLAGGERRIRAWSWSDTTPPYMTGVRIFFRWCAGAGYAVGGGARRRGRGRELRFASRSLQLRSAQCTHHTTTDDNHLVLRDRTVVCNDLHLRLFFSSSFRVGRGISEWSWLCT